MSQDERRIRVIAVGLLVIDDLVLAEEYPPIEGHHRFVRAIGGGVDFGERAEEALSREFREELGVELDAAVPVAVTENIYSMPGRFGHEIVHVYAVRCAELERLPPDERLDVADATSTVGWYELADLEADVPPFYPAGMAQLARQLVLRQRET